MMTPGLLYCKIQTNVSVLKTYKFKHPWQNKYHTFGQAGRVPPTLIPPYTMLHHRWTHAKSQKQQQSTEHPQSSSDALTLKSKTLLPTLPPWSLKGEAWWIVLSICGPSRGHVLSRDQNSRKQRKGLAPAHFDALTQKSNKEDELSKGFCGGSGQVQIVRYSTSPVGAYDELLIIPGSFRPPEKCSGRLPAHRVTRIYVSTLASVLSGRHNWNIPKHLARFEFASVKNFENKMMVKVFGLRSFRFTPATDLHRWSFEPEFFEQPFFSIIIQRHLPRLSIPVDLQRFPFLSMTLIQPPLRAQEPAEPDNSELNCGLIGTSDWKKTKLRLKGRFGLCSFEGNLNGRKGRFGDGDLFPDVQPYRLGIHFPIINLEFPSAESV